MDTEGLSLRVWHDITVVDDVDLKYQVPTHALKSVHVVEVAKGILSLVCGNLMEEQVVVDLWRYRYHGGPLYTENLCAMTSQQLE